LYSNCVPIVHSAVGTEAHRRVCPYLLYISAPLPDIIEYITRLRIRGPYMIESS
jgi:hypothetical protein